MCMGSDAEEGVEGGITLLYILRMIVLCRRQVANDSHLHPLAVVSVRSVRTEMPVYKKGPPNMGSP